MNDYISQLRFQYAQSNTEFFKSSYCPKVAMVQSTFSVTEDESIISGLVSTFVYPLGELIWSPRSLIWPWARHCCLLSGTRLHFLGIPYLNFIHVLGYSVASLYPTQSLVQTFSHHRLHLTYQFIPIRNGQLSHSAAIQQLYSVVVFGLFSNFSFVLSCLLIVWGYRRLCVVLAPLSSEH